MKLFKSLFVAICTLYLLEITKTDAIGLPSNTEVIRKIEELRDILKTGNEELGIPNCNPLKITHLGLDLDALNSEAVSGQLTLDDFVLEGLPFFEFTYDRKGTKITFTLDVDLTLYTEYTGSVLLFDFIDIYGTGSISIELKKIHAEILIIIGTNVPIEARELNATLLIDEANFEITGLLNDEEKSEIISKDLSDLVSQFLNDKKDWVTEQISPIIKDLFNQYVPQWIG